MIFVTDAIAQLAWAALAIGAGLAILSACVAYLASR